MAGDAAMEVVEALKTALNAGSWTQTFTAVRSYDLTAELTDDSETVHVDVALRADSGEQGRGTTENLMEVNVVVRQKSTCTNAKLDAMMVLLEEFRDDQMTGRLTTASEGDAVCIEWERRPAYYPQHVRNFRQFTGMLTLTYQLSRTIS